VGLAADLVTVAEARLKPVAAYALGRTLVVDDLPAARRAFETMQGGFQIVTREGELMRSGGSVTGGASGKKGEEATFLAREREWRALPAEIAGLQQQQAVLSTQLAGYHDQANALKQALQALAERLQQKQQQRRDMQALADKVGRSLEQVVNSLQWQQALQAKSETELTQIDQRQAEDRRQLEQLSQERAKAETEIKRLAGLAQALSAEKLLADLNEARSVVASLQARQASQQALLDNYQAAQRQVTAQIEIKWARAESLAVEREALLRQQSELQIRTGGFAEQLARLGSEIEAGERKLAELEAKQIKLQQDERQLRQRMQRLELEHNRLSLDAARCQDELDHMQRQIHDDVGLVQLEMADEQIGQPILPVGDDLPTIDLLPPGVEEDVQRLKVQIRRMGNINFEAPQEYAELKDRHEFLSAQISDLEAAISNLRAIIAKLDETMVEAFIVTFEQVAKEFQRYFKTLFGGGEAQLILTDPNNMLETGVDIVARPPGKRLQNLGLLSGGERSLTAQALIFALLRISPTPFVIFDEVDAMLDEANVTRFRDALKRLAEDIQFIVITHNRTTIEAANTLYGVSMGDDSVSQVYSLKIDDWLADRQNGK
jgi:chromosome segregation protein